MWWREGQVLGAYQGSSHQSRGQGGRRYQLDLASQTMISENCFFLENFVGFVKLLSLSSTLCFFFLTFRTYWTHEKIYIDRKYDCCKS